MTSVQSGATTIQFGYDADGNRVRKEVVGGTESTYVRGADGQTIAVYENGSKAFVNLLAGGQILGTYDGSQRRYFLKDHLGTVRTTVVQSGNVDGWDDYYPFGLVMDGRSDNTSTPDDLYKFTGHELDEEAGLGLIHMNARGMDPVIGRMLQIDNYHHKYPSYSPYGYAANNPLRFTDMTGDTIDVDPELEKEIVYGPDHERAGEAKDYADYTEADHHRREFQIMWNEYGELLTALFGENGKYGTTNLNFVFSPMKRPKGSGYRRDAGLTAYGKQGNNPKSFNVSKSITTIDFNPGEAQIDIYLNPNNAQGESLNTSSHEVKHAVLIFIDMLYGGIVRDSDWQHKQINTHKASLGTLLPALKGGN